MRHCRHGHTCSAALRCQRDSLRRRQRKVRGGPVATLSLSRNAIWLLPLAMTAAPAHRQARLPHFCSYHYHPSTAPAPLSAGHSSSALVLVRPGIPIDCRQHCSSVPLRSFCSCSSALCLLVSSLPFLCPHPVCLVLQLGCVRHHRRCPWSGLCGHRVARRSTQRCPLRRRVRDVSQSSELQKLATKHPNVPST